MVRSGMPGFDRQRFANNIILVIEGADDVAREVFGRYSMTGHGQMNHRGATDTQLEIAANRTFNSALVRKVGDGLRRPDAARFSDVDGKDVGRFELFQDHGILKRVNALVRDDWNSDLFSQSRHKGDFFRWNRLFSKVD